MKKDGTKCMSGPQNDKEKGFGFFTDPFLYFVWLAPFWIGHFLRKAANSTTHCPCSLCC